MAPEYTEEATGRVGPRCGRGLTGDFSSVVPIPPAQRWPPRLGSGTRFRLENFAAPGRAATACAASSKSQPSERREVFSIEVEAGIFGGLEVLGNSPKPRVGHEVSKSGFSDLAVPDVLVPVDARSPRVLGIVDVNRSKARQANCAPQGVDRLGVSLGRRELVAGRMDVARVQADAQPPLVTACGKGVAQMLEAVADGSALPGGGLEQNADPDIGHAREDLVERCREAPDARRFAVAAVRAGVKNEIRDAESPAAADLLGESADGAPPHRRRRGSQVDEIRGMRGHWKPRAADGAAKRPRLDLLDLAGRPGPVALYEDLEGAASDREAAFDRPGGSSGDRLVGADGEI